MTTNSSPIPRFQGVAPMNDHEAICRWLDGDEDAFEGLIASYRNLVRGVCASILNPNGLGHLLDDAEQRTWWNAWCNRARFDPTKGTFDTWICCIARNVSIDLVQRESSQRRRRGGVQPAIEEGELNDVDPRHFAVAEALLFVFWSFPPHRRAFLRLLYFSPHPADPSRPLDVLLEARLSVWVSSDGPPADWRATLEDGFSVFVVQTASSPRFSVAEAGKACGLCQTTAYAVRHSFRTKVLARLLENGDAVELLSPTA